MLVYDYSKDLVSSHGNELYLSQLPNLHSFFKIILSGYFIMKTTLPIKDGKVNFLMAISLLKAHLPKVK